MREGERWKEREEICLHDITRHPSICSQSEIYHSKYCPVIYVCSNLKAALFDIDSAAREKQKSLAPGGSSSVVQGQCGLGGGRSQAKAAGLFG